MTEQLADELATRFFSGVADTRLRLHIYRLLRLVDWQHREFADGALHQVLVLMVHDPVADVARCSLRLQMRTGTVYALSATGAPARILDSLPLISGVLADTPYVEPVCPDFEPVIADLLEGAGIGGVVITLERIGALLPAMPVGAGMQCKLVLAGLNRLSQCRGLPPMEALPEEIAEVIGAAVPHRQPAVQAYLRSLDQPALNYCNSTAVKTRSQLTLYNHLVAEGGGYCRNRLQALRVLPWLFPVLTMPVAVPRAWAARPLEAGWPQRIAQVQHAIDQGAPLFEAVAAVLRVPPEVVRWLGRRELPADWTFDMRRADLLLRLLSWLPPEQRPAGPLGFAQLVRAGDAILAPFRRICESERFPDFRRPQYGSIVRRWLKELARDEGDVGDEDQFEPLRMALVDARDFLAAVHAASLRRRRRDGGDADEERELVVMLDRLRGLSLRRMLALSRAWHAEAAEFSLAAGPDAPFESGALRWPMVLSGPWMSEGLTITELGTALSLQEEGRAMLHCIGGFAEDCASGDSLAFSVCDVGGNRLSTAQLLLVDGGRQVILGQHRGVRNAAPSPVCDMAVAALVRYLNRDDFTAGRAARFASQRQRRARRLQHQLELSAAESHYQQQLQDTALEVFWRARRTAR